MGWLHELQTDLSKLLSAIPNLNIFDYISKLEKNKFSKKKRCKKQSI